MASQSKQRASIDGVNFKLVFANPGYEAIPFNKAFLDHPNHAHVLTTIASLFIQPIPQLVRKEAQAIVTLALYAAGAEAFLDDVQYEMLTKAVKNYLEHQAREDDMAGNWAMANYVLEQAAARADLDSAN